MGEYARFFHDTTDVNCKLLVVERIHPQSKKFAMGMEVVQVTRDLMTVLNVTLHELRFKTQWCCILVQ